MVEPLQKIPYEQYDCWRLCRHLYREGFGEDLDESPVLAWKHVQEVWWCGDPEDPLTISQPGDVWIFRALGMASHHVGVVVNTVQFIHTRPRVGVCLARLVEWKPRLLQIARLRRLA